MGDGDRHDTEPAACQAGIAAVGVEDRSREVGLLEGVPSKGLGERDLLRLCCSDEGEREGEAARWPVVETGLLLSLPQQSRDIMAGGTMICGRGGPPCRLPAEGPTRRAPSLLPSPPPPVLPLSQPSPLPSPSSPPPLAKAAALTAAQAAVDAPGPSPASWQPPSPSAQAPSCPNPSTALSAAPCPPLMASCAIPTARGLVLLAVTITAAAGAPRPDGILRHPFSGGDGSDDAPADWPNAQRLLEDAPRLWLPSSWRPGPAGGGAEAAAGTSGGRVPVGSAHEVTVRSPGVTAMPAWPSSQGAPCVLPGHPAAPMLLSPLPPTKLLQCP